MLLSRLLSFLWNSIIYGIKSVRKKKLSKVSKDDSIGKKKYYFSIGNASMPIVLFSLNVFCPRK